MARKAKEVALKDVTKRDPETGTEITFSGQQVQILKACKSQILNHSVQIGMQLRIIRDHKLFLLDDADSMTSWLIDNFGGGHSNMKRLMRAADAVAELPEGQHLMDAPIGQILELSSDAESREAIESGKLKLIPGFVVEEDGSQTPLADFVRRLKHDVLASAEEKEAKLKTRLNSKVADIKAQEDLLNGRDQRIKELETEIQTRNDALRELANEQGVDPSRYLLITQKKQALDLLMETAPTALSLLAGIENISTDLIDAEIAGHMNRTFGAIEAGLTRLRETFAVHIQMGPTGIKQRPKVEPGESDSPEGDEDHLK